MYVTYIAVIKLLHKKLFYILFQKQKVKRFRESFVEVFCLYS